MEDEKKLEDFDPSETDAFQETLSKALEPEIVEAEPIDITTDDSSSILTITEEGAADGTGEEKEERTDEVQAELVSIEGMLAVAVEKEKPEEDALPMIDTDFDFEEEVPQEEEVDDAVLENISSQLASQVGGGYVEAEKEERKRKVPIWVVSIGVTAASLILFFVFFFCTSAGRNVLLGTKFGKYLISHVGGALFEEATTFDPGFLLAEPLFVPITPTPFPVAELPPVAEITPTPEPTVTEGPEPTEEPESPEDVEIPQTVYHILILGMDEEDGEVPNADLMILVTLNTEKDEIVLTTLLRNLLVQIPGHTDDKLGAVYSKGGIGLMYDVMETSLGVRPDGYLLFNYNGFEQVIDILGGVSMEITAKEADYLNKTNYITLPENRNLTAGVRHLNGDQALGYCRIRHVGTEQNEYNDLGRAARCRRLVTAVFEQYKSKGMVELYQVTRQCLSYVVTDITGEECTKYLESILNMDGVQVSNYCIPAEGTYQANIIRGSSVLVSDMAQNRALWQELVGYEENSDDIESQSKPIDGED